MFTYEIDFLNEGLRIDDVPFKEEILVDVKMTYQCVNIIYNTSWMSSSDRPTLSIFSQHYKNSPLLIHSAGNIVPRNNNKHLNICVKSNQMDLPYKYLLFFCCNQSVYDVNVGQSSGEWVCMHVLHVYLYFWFSVEQPNRMGNSLRIEKMNCYFDEILLKETTCSTAIHCRNVGFMQTALCDSCSKWSFGWRN